MFAALLSLVLAKAPVWVSLLVQGAFVVAGIVESRRRAKRDRQSREAAARDRIVTVRSTNAPEYAVYGLARVGGVMVHLPFTHGEHHRYASVTIALAPHEIESIEDVYLDGESIGPLDANGYVQDGSPYFWKRFEAATHRVDSAPAKDAIIELPHKPSKIETVSFTTETGSAISIPSGEYELNGNAFKLKTDAAQGQALTIDYQHAPPQKKAYTDSSFNGTTVTLPEATVIVLPETVI